MIKPAVIKLILFLFVISGLTACGGGGGSDPAPTPPSTDINGGGVKGPLANAIVTVYAFDSSQPGFKDPTVVATATTNGNAAITGLALPFPVTPPYIMEFTSTPGTTTDITTGLFPVITTLRTVITQFLLDSGEQIYATPLTTMAVDIAIANGTTSMTAAQFETALTAAAAQVVSTMGFGLDSSVDIFDTPPLIDNTTDTTVEQTNVAAYRAAVEAVTAIAFQINQQSSGGDTDSVLAELAADLADGGGIDGSAGSQINTNTLQVLEQDPATLVIPNTTQTVAEVQTILATETTTTGSTTTTTELTDGSITTETAPAETNPDIDGDGVLNVEDAYPNDPLADTDTDGDGAPDFHYVALSTDGNGDGINDRDPANTADGTGDADDDNDSWLDAEDDFPLDASRFLDPALDRDSDTVANGSDNCPLTSNTDQLDTDANGQGDACSNDNDGDGVDDGTDNCPSNANPSQIDTDIDGTGDACDTDIDGDTVLNTADIFPFDSTETIDTDGDGIGNSADTDDDNDGVLDGADTGVNPTDGTTPCSVLRDCDGDGVFDGADFAPTDNTVAFNFSPVVINDTATADEDAATFSIAVTANDTDDDGNPNDVVTLTAIGLNDTNLGVAVISGNNINYTPVADASGTDTFSYTVSDGAVSSTGSVTVTITAINDAPIITQVGPLAVSMDEDGIPTAFVAPVIDATDAEGDTLNWTGTTAANGTATVTGAGASPTISYVSNANFNGADSFDVTVSDGNGGSDTITVNVTIAAQNDLPTIGGSPLTAAVDGIAYSFTPTANDVDGEALSFSIQNQPSWTTFNTSDGTLSGTPGPADVGASFSNIIISVTAGGDTVDLPAFSIIVSATAPGGAVWDNFNWDDGSTWQ